MAEPTSGGKWAAEAFDFLRLHQRVRNHVYGLALWQLAWALLLWLASRLIGANALELPYADPRCAWESTPCFGWSVWPFAQLYPVGAVILLLLWFRASRLSIFVTRPLWVAIRGLAYWFLIAATLLAAFALLSITLLSEPVRRVLVRRAAAASAPAVTKPRAKRSLRERVLAGDFEAQWAQQLLFAGVSPLIDMFVPPVIIAVARIESFTLDEELVAARIPAQLFVDAQSRLRDSLRGSQIVADARIEILPEALRIISPQRARRVRRWLGYDALLWGTMTREAEPALFLNVETPRRRTEEKGERFERSWGPLAGTDEPGSTSIVVRPGRPLDAYVALLLALRSSIETRAAATAITFPGGRDPVSTDARPLLKRIQDLRLGLLDRLEEPVRWPTEAPLPASVLVGDAVAWVKSRFSDLEYGFERGDEEVTIEALAQTVERCLALAPGNPDLHYLAAIFGLAAESPNLKLALHEFEQGWKRDRITRFRGWSSMTAVAGMALSSVEDAPEASERRRAGTAKAALYAELAMRLDAEATRHTLARSVRESESFKRLGYGFSSFEQLPAGEQHLWRLAGVQPPPPPPKRAVGAVPPPSAPPPPSLNP